MLARVLRTIERRGLCPPGARVGVACSGGPDSVALLALLGELGGRLEIRLGVVHLNHRLRGAESDADEAFVRSLAERAGLPCHVRSADVAAIADSEGRNLEETARMARHGYFAELTATGVYDRIALGHTRSDQAETVLFRLLRGSSPDGLRAIRPALPGGVVRPLIEVDRADVLAFIAERGLEFRTDSSNADCAFARNRLRAELLPALRRDWNPRLDESLARLAAQADEDAEYWETRVTEAAGRLLRREGGALAFAAAEALALEAPLRRRFLHRALAEAAPGAARDFRHVEDLRELLESPNGGARRTLPGLVAERSSGEIRLVARGERAAEPAAVVVEPPAAILAPDGRTAIRLSIGPRAADGGRYTNGVESLLDWGRLPKPLVLRGWRPGDRVAAGSGERARSLGRLLKRAGVAVWDRPSWPVLAAGQGAAAADDEIVWARGVGSSARFRPAGNIGAVLRVTETDDSMAVSPAGS
jgi:tRNA(Ile)-lysidine synthase